MAETVCKSKSVALAALDTIARILPRGMQRDALNAVIDWIEENYPKDFREEEVIKKIQRIYEDLYDEANQKALIWSAHGGEPPNGARVEVPYLFNAATKTWELENEMPPVWTEEHYLPKQDLDNEDEDDQR